MAGDDREPIGRKENNQKAPRRASRRAVAETTIMTITKKTSMTMMSMKRRRNACRVR